MRASSNAHALTLISGQKGGSHSSNLNWERWGLTSADACGDGGGAWGGSKMGMGGGGVK